MARVKGGKISAKRRRNILSQVKGYRFARSKKERAAKEAIFHAGKYAFAHRRDKKNDFKRLWNVRINAGLQGLVKQVSEGKRALRGLFFRFGGQQCGWYFYSALFAKLNEACERNCRDNEGCFFPLAHVDLPWCVFCLEPRMGKKVTTG